MQFDAMCIQCLIRRQARLAQRHGEPEKTYRYLREVLAMLLEAPEGVAAPFLIPRFDDAYDRYWPGDDYYGPLKADSNRVMMERLPAMEAQAAGSPDPLLAALKLAQAANFIDYGTMAGQVDLSEVDRILAAAPDNPIDEAVYAALCGDLARARELLYLGDNAGEIVADRVLLAQLRRRYPALRITYVVRGGPALNDVTREDADFAGIGQYAAVIDNGSRIPGTELAWAGPELQAAAARADVLFAKGQANFETLSGCGLNVYYTFLCKCERFTRWFQVPRMTPMLVRERDLHIDSPYC